MCISSPFAEHDLLQYLSKQSVAQIRESPSTGQMGPKGQVGGRKDPAKAPPLQKLTRLSLSFGGGLRGPRGA